MGKGPVELPYFPVLGGGEEEGTEQCAGVRYSAEASLEPVGFVSLWVDTFIGKAILLGILGNKNNNNLHNPLFPYKTSGTYVSHQILREKKRCLYETLVPYIVGYHQRSNPSTSEISPSVLFPVPSGSVPCKLSPLLTSPLV